LFNIKLLKKSYKSSRWIVDAGKTPRDHGSLDEIIVRKAEKSERDDFQKQF